MSSSSLRGRAGPAALGGIALGCGSGCASWTAGPSPEAAASPHRADEAEIGACLQQDEKKTPFVRSAPDLDWENAFGIRYDDLAKRDAFSGAVVAPLQVGDTGGPRDRGDTGGAVTRHYSLLRSRRHFSGPALRIEDRRIHLTA